MSNAQLFALLSTMALYKISSERMLSIYAIVYGITTIVYAIVEPLIKYGFFK
jgi:hypothetical protein